MSEVLTVAISIIGGTFGGAFFAARLSRKNTRLTESDRLLTEAFNDAFAAISDVTQLQGERNRVDPSGPSVDPAAERGALARYGSATSRIALHGSPEVVRAFVAFQKVANTGTVEGQERLIDATNEVRKSLGRSTVDGADLAILHFGTGKLRGE